MSKIEATYIVTRIRDLNVDPPIMPATVSFSQEKPVKMSLTNLCRTVIRTAMGYYDPQATYVVTEVVPHAEHYNSWQFSNDRFF